MEDCASCCANKGEVTAPMTTNDHPCTLVIRAQNGNRSAFDALVRLYRDRLISLIHSRLGKQLGRYVDAEDILQEALVKAFQSIERFQWRGDDSFLRWLSAIAEHRIQDAARRHGAIRPSQLEVDIAAPGVSPSKAERRNERFERFEAALKQLSPDYSQAILLARIEGLSIEEVARRMNRSPNAVSHILLRALRKLRESLGDTESLHLPDRRLAQEGEADGN